MKQILTALTLLVGCSDLPDETETKEDATNLTGEITFSGYVQVAFEVTVDGERYSDMEAFFLIENERIIKLAADAGYPNAVLDARIGYQDLYEDMTVYLSATSERGYLGTDHVASDGEFAVSLPSDAESEEYKVKATKRIAVKLDDTTAHCYNFQASETSVKLEAKEKPIILDTFESKLTSYQCSNISEDTGITVPKPIESVPPSKLKLGMTKSEVTSVLGLDGMFRQGSQWCYRLVANCVVYQLETEPCICSVTFDEDGKVADFDNIKSSLLDESLL